MNEELIIQLCGNTNSAWVLTKNGKVFTYECWKSKCWTELPPINKITATYCNEQQ